MKSKVEKVIKGLECCTEGTCPSIFSKAYKECPYTLGLYCRQDRLLKDALEVIKELSKSPNMREKDG